MKGIIFNSLERFIITHYGEDTLDEIMENCSLDTQDPFVGPGTYPDQDFSKLIQSTIQQLGTSRKAFMVHFGQYTFDELKTRHPNFLVKYDHPKAFLLTVESIIHVEVEKLYNGTYLPTFQYHSPSPQELTITYYSKRKMYDLMEGIINGVAEHFSIGIQQTRHIYKKEGQEFCDFYLKFDE